MSPTKPKAPAAEEAGADWHRRVVDRSLGPAAQRSIDRGSSLIRAAATLLERSGGDSFTVQDVADEAGQSMRTLYHYFESKDDLLLAVFEEAMRTYARMIEDAIADLSDPLERLGGGVIAAVRMQEYSGSGVTRGLARLRLKLAEVDPELIARSQEPVTTLMRGLLEDAAEAGRIETDDLDGSAFMILALRSAFITSRTLGNDYGVELPSVHLLTAFCLRGLGASPDDDWYESIDSRLVMPTGGITLDAGTGGPTS